MLLAVALTHLADPENAKSAYEQAINLDMKDPAVPLNFAVFLSNRNEIDEAKNMLNMFEMRVQKLRSSPGLDADPDVRSKLIFPQLDLFEKKYDFRSFKQLQTWRINWITHL